jgi:hypothetical protein
VTVISIIIYVLWTLECLVLYSVFSIQCCDCVTHLYDTPVSFQFFLFETKKVS